MKFFLKKAIINWQKINWWIYIYSILNFKRIYCFWCKDMNIYKYNTIKIIYKIKTSGLEFEYN